MRRSSSGWAALVVATLWLAPESHADSGADFTARQADELQIRGRPLSAWLRQLRSGDPNSRVAAADALGEAGPAAWDALPALAHVLRTDDRRFMDAAHRALLRIDPGARLSVLRYRQEMKSPDVDTRYCGLCHFLLVEEVQPAAAQAALLDALHDEDGAVRWFATMWLGRQSTDRATAVPALIEALNDKESGVRAEAARALRNIGEYAQSAAVPLAHALADPEERVRDCAFDALLKIGRDRSDLAPVLLGNLKHSERDVRYINAFFLTHSVSGN